MDPGVTPRQGSLTPKLYNYCLLGLNSILGVAQHTVGTLREGQGTLPGGDDFECDNLSVGLSDQPGFEFLLCDLGKLFNLSLPQFLHLSSGSNSDRNCLPGLTWRFWVLVYVCAALNSMSAHGNLCMGTPTGEEEVSSSSLVSVERGLGREGS